MSKKYKIKAFCYDKRGRILSIGENSYVKSHPLQAYIQRRVGYPEKVYIHAEVQAIIRARGKDIHKIRVERYNSKGEQQNACPCAGCQLAIKEAGIKLVEFTV